MALSALGKKLVGEGDIDAGHMCYLLSPSVSPIGYSIINSPSSFTLIGQNPSSQINIDAIRMTEILEYAMSLSVPSKKNDYIGLPHLQAHKLLHAWYLSESGQVLEASK